MEEKDVVAPAFSLKEQKSPSLQGSPELGETY